MVFKFFQKFSFVLFLGMCCYCRSAYEPTPRQIQDSTSTKPDTNSISRPDTITVLPPDTVLIDTFPAKNPDAILNSSARFGSQNIYTESQLVSKSGIYWKANDYIGRPNELAYTFMEPQADTMRYRPFVLLVHEGAFLFGSLDAQLAKARLLSRKGYATASIDYRLGFNGGSEANACGGTQREVLMAMYRSVQDINAALHYFISRADQFGIDPGQIILSGSSSGAMAISALVYMKESDFEKLSPGIVNLLGKLDPYSVEGSYRVKALLTSLGYGIISSNYITPVNAKPTLFFQRSGDNVLPYRRGPLFYCDNYFYTEGANDVSLRLTKIKVPFELNYEPLVGHQLSYPEEYVINRYALFLKRIWGNDRREIINENYKTIQDIVLK